MLTAARRVDGAVADKQGTVRRPAEGKPRDVVGIQRFLTAGAASMLSVHNHDCDGTARRKNDPDYHPVTDRVVVFSVTERDLRSVAPSSYRPARDRGFCLLIRGRFTAARAIRRQVHGAVVSGLANGYASVAARAIEPCELRLNRDTRLDARMLPLDTENALCE